MRKPEDTSDGNQKIPMVETRRYQWGNQKIPMVETRRYQWWKPEAINLKIEQHELTNNRWLHSSATYIKTN
jgi:hypothetical protein